jgi:hypothetical protein
VTRELDRLIIEVAAREPRVRSAREILLGSPSAPKTCSGWPQRSDLSEQVRDASLVEIRSETAAAIGGAEQPIH